MSLSFLFLEIINEASENEPTQTPSNHRQRLTTGIGVNMSGFPSNHALNTLSRRESPTRQPLSNFSPNGTANRHGLSGYGMSAGLKVSHQQATAPNTPFARPTIRSRSLFCRCLIAMSSTDSNYSCTKASFGSQWWSSQRLLLKCFILLST